MMNNTEPTFRLIQVILDYSNLNNLVALELFNYIPLPIRQDKVVSERLHLYLNNPAKITTLSKLLIEIVLWPIILNNLGNSVLSNNDYELGNLEDKYTQATIKIKDELTDMFYYIIQNSSYQTWDFSFNNIQALISKLELLAISLITDQFNLIDCYAFKLEYYEFNEDALLIRGYIRDD